MKLAVKQRVSEKKKDIKEIRREGNIPAILYSSKAEPVKLVVSGIEFDAVLRKMKPGQLPTSIFILVDSTGERRAIIKDIQYHLTTYHVSHIDFEELVENIPVCVKVPINCTGVVDCIGGKLGGFLRQVVRHVKVECLPENIPSEFLVDVKDLGIRQSKRLKDLVMPSGVRPLAHLEEVIVVVAKK
jgi:large subunit ribosomal protein L25